MLASLMPGIRDLRTPLAVGYIWLIVFWLWIPASAKLAVPTEGVLGDLAQLSGYVGVTGLASAASFVAYLVGTLSSALNAPFVRLGAYLAHVLGGEVDSVWMARVRLSFTDFLGSSITPKWSNHRNTELYTAFNIRNGRMSITGSNALHSFAYDEVKAGRLSPGLLGRFVSHLIWEVPRQKNAVLGRDPELFSTLDRLTSECEFRVGVAAPLVAFIATLAWRSSIVWLVGLVIVLALIRSGVKQRIEAGDLMADLVRIRRIEIPVPPLKPPDGASEDVAEIEPSTVGPAGASEVDVAS